MEKKVLPMVAVPPAIDRTHMNVKKQRQCLNGWVMLAAPYFNEWLQKCTTSWG
jgi:hypothetical protein